MKNLIFLLLLSSISYADEYKHIQLSDTKKELSDEIFSKIERKNSKRI